MSQDTNLSSSYIDEKTLLITVKDTYQRKPYISFILNALSDSNYQLRRVIKKNLKFSYEFSHIEKRLNNNNSFPIKTIKLDVMIKFSFVAAHLCLCTGR